MLKRGLGNNGVISTATGVQLRNSQDLWIGVSRSLLIASLVVGSLDEFAVLELGAGPDEGDQVGCVDRAPACLGGFD